MTTMDVGDALDEIYSRLYKVEQRTAVVAGGSFPDGVVIGGGTSNPRPILASVSAPIGPIVLVAGSYLDNIWIDASWFPPQDNSAARFQVELVKETAPDVYEFVRHFETGATSIRMDRLEAGETYGVRIYGINQAGISSVSFPEEGYVEIVSSVDATIPPAVTDVVAVRGTTQVIVRFTGLTGVPDLDLYQVQVSNDRGFNIVLDEEWTTSTVLTFDWAGTDLPYARVRPIDTSGNEGPWATSEPPAADTVVLDRMIVGGIDAAKIVFGFMQGDRIEANSIDVNRLMTSSLIATTITLGAGGNLQAGNPPTTGLLINEQGLSLYGSGIRKIFLDAATGTGTFTGSITGSDISGGTITGTIYKSAASGKRVEIQTGVANVIRFHSGQGNETAPATIETFPDSNSGIIMRSGTQTIAPTEASIYMEPGSLGTSYLSLNAKTILIRGSYGFVVDPCAVSLDGSFTINNDLSGGTNAYLDAPIVRGSRGSQEDVHTSGVQARGPGVALFSAWDTTFGAVCWGIVGANGAVWNSYDAFLSSWAAINAGGFFNQSSLSSKRNIKVVNTKVLDRVLNMRPVIFTRPLHKLLEGNEEHSLADLYNLGQERFGFIAEELHDVVPEAVCWNDKGEPQGIDYGSLVPMLVQSIQELHALIAKGK